MWCNTSGSRLRDSYTHSYQTKCLLLLKTKHRTWSECISAIFYPPSSCPILGNAWHAKSTVGGAEAGRPFLTAYSVLNSWKSNSDNNPVSWGIEGRSETYNKLYAKLGACLATSYSLLLIVSIKNDDGLRSLASKVCVCWPYIADSGLTWISTGLNHAFILFMQTVERQLRRDWLSLNGPC